MPISQISSIDVYRKAVQELNKSDVSGDWRAQVDILAGCYRTTPAGIYLQDHAYGPYLRLILFMEKQLKFLHSTPYAQRYLHLDATGCLVKVNKRHTINYNTILNYFCLVKNPLLGSVDSSFVLCKLT